MRKDPNIILSDEWESADSIPELADDIDFFVAGCKFRKNSKDHKLFVKRVNDMMDKYENILVKNGVKVGNIWKRIA